MTSENGECSGLPKATPHTPTSCSGSSRASAAVSAGLDLNGACREQRYMQPDPGLRRRNRQMDAGLPPEAADHAEEIVGARIAFRAEHPHQALRRCVDKCSPSSNPDRGIDEVSSTALPVSTFRTAAVPRHLVSSAARKP